MFWKILFAFLSKILSMLVSRWWLSYNTLITFIIKNILKYALLLVGLWFFISKITNKIYKIVLKFIRMIFFLIFRTVPLLIRGLATRASQIVKPTMLSSLYISIYFKTIYWQHLLLLTSQNFAKNITVWNVTLNFYGCQLCHFFGYFWLEIGFSFP